MKRNFVFWIILLSLSSCATILNNRKQTIDIHTNEPVRLAVNNDTIPYQVNHHGIIVDRSKELLHLELFNENIKKDLYIQSRLSTAYWMNFFSPYFTGFLIDLVNEKRFAYPKTLYIDLNEVGNTYLTDQPIVKVYPEIKGIFKIAPLKTLNVVNPMLELSYEWPSNPDFSSQVSAAYIFPMSVWDYNSGDINPNMRGFSISLEEKYYLTRPSPNGLYLGFELSYLNNNFDRMYFFEDENIADTSDYYDYSYRDSIHIKKHAFSMNLKLGYQFFAKHLSFDIYVGFGARFKDVQHFDRIKPDDVFAWPRHPNIFYISDEEGKYWTVSLPLNFKIGWTF